MTDETIIPTDAEAENSAIPVDAAEVINETEETPVVENTSEESEVVEESSEVAEDSSDVSETEETVAAPVRATPLTALSARAERPARGKSERGGEKSGRRDDRRGGKS